VEVNADRDEVVEVGIRQVLKTENRKVQAEEVFLVAKGLLLG
jgi:hypothetical protein